MTDQLTGPGQPADSPVATEAIPAFSEMMSFSGRIMWSSLGAVIPFLLVCLAINTAVSVAVMSISTPENFRSALLIEALVLVFIVYPVVAMAGARLTLSLWDGERADLSVFVVALMRYRDGLVIVLWYLAYLVRLSLIGALTLMPMMLMMAAISGILMGPARFLLIIGGLVLTIWLVKLFLWGRARRVAPFLCDFNCFMSLDLSANDRWRAITERWYEKLDDERYRPFLNGALAFVVAVDVIKVMVFAAAGGLSPAGTSTGLFGLSLAVGLFQAAALIWLSIAGAGFFRLALGSGQDLAGPSRSYGLH